jgi:hypothetical protein
VFLRLTERRGSDELGVACSSEYEPDPPICSKRLSHPWNSARQLPTARGRPRTDEFTAAAGDHSTDAIERAGLTVTLRTSKHVVESPGGGRAEPASRRLALFGHTTVVFGEEGELMNSARPGKTPATSRLALLAVSLLASTLLGCATSPPPGDDTSLERAYARFQTYLNDCSKSIGIDPRTATGVGERELMAKEREWRSCAYEGIRAVLVPATRHPELYGQLISEDQTMTDRIAKGSMTRSERRARLEQLRETIAQKEAQSSAELPQERAERNAQLVRQVRGLP